MQSSHKLDDEIAIAKEMAQKGLSSQIIYPISKVRGKISIGILKRFTKNHRIWIKKWVTANLCQLIKSKIAIVSAGHKKIEGCMSKKTSRLLIQC